MVTFPINTGINFCILSASNLHNIKPYQVRPRVPHVRPDQQSASETFPASVPQLDPYLVCPHLFNITGNYKQYGETLSTGNYLKPGSLLRELTLPQ